MFGFLKKDNNTAEAQSLHSSVGYLGKMPLCPDFVKYQIRQRETIAFDNWLQDAYALYSRQQVEHTNKTESMRKLGFALSGSADEHCIAGMMAPSQDKSGRHYPFAILAVLVEPSLKQHGVNLVQGSWQFTQDLRELWSSSWMQSNLQLLNQQVADLEQRLRGMEMSMDPMKVLASLRDVSLGELFDRMSIELNERSAFVEACSNILRGISHRGTRRTHFGVRLPLGKDVDFQLIVFWVFLVTTMVREPNWRPQVYWAYPDNHFNAELNVFFKPISASYFSHLISDHPYDDYILDVTKVAKNITNISEFSRDIANYAHLNVIDAARRWSKES
ncbi:type VI secretion system-associated protein TagF [Pleionea mediterranea]|uniref:Type VI secretion system ImpM family protein n=1 Tax=Pleionea mediterranea TaxID=523701 RepID=A0A316F6S3_9GAMM|nr:type VI secretion system-associated protein TagF [Pleionea mediterranea]PWK42548.1 type VI secretion system ImpM family protein [Pleionea mediterranea]